MTALAVVDWDGTLFPSTRGGEPPEAIQALESSVCALLNALAQRGPTMIVTNSQQGWVDQCVQRFGWWRMLGLMSLVPVISARSRFETRSQDPVEWKRLAFAELLEMTGATQLISIGDGETEMRAAQALRGGGLVGKCIRTAPFPSAMQIHEHCEALLKTIDLLYAVPSDLDVNLALRV